MVYRPRSTDHGLQTTVYRPRSTDHGLQTTVYRPRSTDHGLQTTVHRPPSTDHRPQSVRHADVARRPGTRDLVRREHETTSRGAKLMTFASNHGATTHENMTLPADASAKLRVSHRKIVFRRKSAKRKTRRPSKWRARQSTKIDSKESPARTRPSCTRTCDRGCGLPRVLRENIGTPIRNPT
jgi:CD68 antigen